jgi:hypothetical protein
MTAAARSGDLHVKISKRADGASVLHCQRADGSATWQKQDGRQASYFPFHDLTHFAVETTLRLPRGFFGMIADGWDIVDTTGKGARGKVPPDGLFAEQVVGLFDRERVGGAEVLSAADFNAQLDRMMEPSAAGSLRRFTDQELAATRRRIDELHDQWAALPDGEALELSFTKQALSR